LQTETFGAKIVSNLHEVLLNLLREFPGTNF